MTAGLDSAAAKTSEEVPHAMTVRTPTSDGKAPVCRGYARSVSGDTITYDSPHPRARHALLCRATGGRSIITWETAPVERGPVRLVWLAGLGCNLGERRFDLSIEGEPVLSFTSADRESWTIRSDDGCVLAFQTDLVDRHQDRFGLMSLTLPASRVRPGRPLILSIQGEAAGSLPRAERRWEGVPPPLRFGRVLQMPGLSEAAKARRLSPRSTPMRLRMKGWLREARPARQVIAPRKPARRTAAVTARS